jgi:hypothetical protein
VKPHEIRGYEMTTTAIPQATNADQVQLIKMLESHSVIAGIHAGEVCALDERTYYAGNRVIRQESEWVAIKNLKHCREFLGY